MANINASELAGLLLRKLIPLNKNGKKKVAYFSVNTTTQPVANGDTINLCVLPKGARILGGRVTFGAMGASATLTIGTSASAAKYLGSTDVSAIGSSTALASTQALGYGDELADETTIIGTAGGANYAAAKDLTGHIDYVVD